jgi:FKBP-type peptidyl-prolyl cis-trans isomerase
MPGDNWPSRNPRAELMFAQGRADARVGPGRRSLGLADRPGTMGLGPPAAPRPTMFETIFALLPLVGATLTPPAASATPVAPAPASSATASPLQDPRQTPRPIPADGDNVVRLPNGLVYSVLRPGDPEGRHPQLGDWVTLDYTCWLLDGTQVDCTYTRGIPGRFRIGDVIRGWGEAMGYTTPGGRMKVTIPPDLAYGPAGAGQVIPPDATLIFDMELLSVEPGPVLPDFVPLDANEAVTLESGIRYQVLEPGEGEGPEAHETFDLDYSIWSLDGDVIEHSALANGPIRARSGEPPLPFLGEVPPLMKPGAVWIVEVPFMRGIGASPAPAQYMKWREQPQIWRLELVKVLRPLPLPPFELEQEPLRVETLESGLVIEYLEEPEQVEEEDGSEDRSRPGPRTWVEVHYAGWLEDGTSFDSSYQRGEPARFRADRVIRGWTEGLQRMLPGTAVRLRIPADLAYGRLGRPPTIPPNSNLIFHVHLLAIVPEPM